MSYLLNSVLALAAITATTGEGEPSEIRWTTDYGAALEATKAAKRPLLVVLDRQPERLLHVEAVSFGQLPPRNELLAKYTLCHVDVTTPYGQAVARNFKAKSFPTTVIIDKTAARQIFSKIGRFGDDEWRATLTRYQTGELATARTSAAVCRT